MLGFVLSGGGARGAYEAGVLRYVLTTLSPQLDRPVRPDVICGTSIGAITGAWVAAHGVEGAQTVSDFWSRMTPDDVYRFRVSDLVRVPDKFLRRAAPVERGVSLFDPEPLYALVRGLRWDDLHARIDRRELKAFSIGMTDVANGRSVHLVDGIPGERETPTMSLRARRIHADHCLASAAIPFVFPAVKVDGRYYVDGALRQNTPLAPAIRLGVSRALVVGVKRLRAEDARGIEAVAPTPAFLAGKALNALLLDPVEEDIRRVGRISELLEWSESAYPGYLDRLAREFRAYRPIQTVHIRPSEDLGRVAAELFPGCEGDLPWATRMLLRGVAAGENADEADLVSYLLFHHHYTGALEDLGFRDAAHASEGLARLFADEDRATDGDGVRAG